MRGAVRAVVWVLVAAGASCGSSEAAPGAGKAAGAAAAAGKPAAAAGKPAAGGLDTAAIERLTGATGKLNEKENVFKVSVPRSDLAVTVAGGVKLTPALGLTAWASFQRMGNDTMVMGDIVLTEDQVNPVLSVALDNGLDVTALHNHFLWDSPKVMFMHISGMGDQSTLAAAVGKVFAKLKEKGEPPPKLSIDPAKSTLQAGKLDDILSTKGDYKDGVYKATFGRTTKMSSTDVGNAMGVNTWCAFAGSPDSAIVDGDFAVLESELQPVLRALRKGNISITAIHQHMTGESPRIMFLHYWGTGHATDLAQTVKTALDMTAH